MTGPRGVDALLTQRIGLDPESVGASLIERGLQARKSALGLGDGDDYDRLVRSSGEELQELIEEVVVPESWFFRDERPFAHLQDHVRTRWLIEPDRPPLRVLSLPCAGGEEPYSIAIAVRETGLAPGRFRVDAMDISARSLARAMRGVYGRNAFRGADLSFRDRHFREVGGSFELDPAVRGTVRFLRGNLLDPDLLKAEPGYDVIFCRNLLIYFTEPARRQASATLDRLLVPSGLLFLGHAERPEPGGTLYVSVGPKGSFCYQRASEVAAGTLRGLPGPSAGAKALTAPSGSPAARPRRDAGPQAPYPRGGKAADAGVAGASPARPRSAPAPTDRGLEGESPATRRNGKGLSGEPASSPLLDQAAERADQGRYDEAVALCERAIGESGPSARAFVLLGMACQAAGDRARAEAALHKAVYLDAHHDEALLALALLAERRGDAAAAAGYRRRADRALARKGAP